MSTKSYAELQQQLTPRQCQALLLMARKPGWTHKQIAAELGVSHHTVNSYNRSEVFRAAYEALTTDMEALSLQMMQQLRTESERLGMESLQVLRSAIIDPAIKPSEKLPLLSEAARWFAILHPEPRNGIAIAASASAGDSEAEARVVIYLPSNGRGDYPDADLVSESETTIDVLGSSVN